MLAHGARRGAAGKKVTTERPPQRSVRDIIAREGRCRRHGPLPAAAYPTAVCAADYLPEGSIVLVCEGSALERAKGCV